MTKEDVQYKKIKGETKNDLTRQRKMYSIRKERERVGLVVVVGSIVNLLADVLMVCSHDPWLIYHRESSPPPPLSHTSIYWGGGEGSEIMGNPI